jgi:hypothetical protein
MADAFMGLDHGQKVAILPVVRAFTPNSKGHSHGTKISAVHLSTGATLDEDMLADLCVPAILQRYWRTPRQYA